MAQRVEGLCPACGSNCLFLGSGGYVTCSLIGCPDPCRASTLLSAPRRARGRLHPFDVNVVSQDGGLAICIPINDGQTGWQAIADAIGTSERNLRHLAELA